MMKRFREIYLDIVCIVIFLICLETATAQFGPECQCNVPVQNRRPCRNFVLDTQGCFQAGCCYDLNPFSFSPRTRCFRRDNRYCAGAPVVTDRCQVPGIQRTSCGFRLNRFTCQFQSGCCYNPTEFPYCFRPVDVGIAPVVTGISVSQWGAWSVCSQSCGTGLSTRTRQCVNADVQSCIQGAFPLNEQKICGEDSCQNWGQWMESACSAVCGIGFKTRSRTCQSGLPGDASCYTTTVECTGPCITRPSPRPTFAPPTPGRVERGRSFVWGTWEPWSDCSENCAPGRRSRSRVCYVNRRLSDPRRCSNFHGTARPTETVACNMEMCREWSEWRSFGCSQTCGEDGTQFESRVCIDVPAAVQNTQSFLNCSQRETRCRLLPCPVQPVSHTQQPNIFTIATGSDESFKTTTRWASPATSKIIVSPPTPKPDPPSSSPSNIFTLAPHEIGGPKTIPIPTEPTEETKPTKKPAKTVTPTTTTKTTDATDPVLMPSWDEWSDWSDCSEKCTPGLRNRTRKCVFSEGTFANPIHCGKGGETEQDACNEDLCPRWGDWITYECSVTCVTPDNFVGVQIVSRECETETSTVANEDCYLEVRECSSEVICPSATEETPETTSGTATTTASAPAEPVWAEWGEWSECSGTCAPGIRTRARTCLPGENLPKACDDGQIETVACNQEYCEAWSLWLPSPCDATCGDGIQPSERICLTGNTTFVPMICYKTEQACSNAPCQVTVEPPSSPAPPEPSTTEATTTEATTVPTTDVTSATKEPTVSREPGSIWEQWGPWSECSRTCAPGVQNRRRKCFTDVPPQNCVEGSQDSRSCNSEFCRFWSSWRAEPCSKSCGEGGIEVSERRCFNGDVRSVPAECSEKITPCRNSPPCEGPIVPEEKDPKLDILFLVDSSDYVDDCEDIKKKMQLKIPIEGKRLNGNNAPTYTRMKKFITDFEDGWGGVSSEGTRIGIQLFSQLCSPKTRTNLYVEKRFNDSHDDFAQKYVKDLPYICGDYWLYWALQCSLSPVLTEEFGDRPKVPSVVVALLSNAPTTSQPSPFLLKVVMKRLRDKGATVLVASATQLVTLAPISRNRYEENMRKLACEGKKAHDCPGYLGSIWKISKSLVAEKIRQALRDMKKI